MRQPVADREAQTRVELLETARQACPYAFERVPHRGIDWTRRADRPSLRNVLRIERALQLVEGRHIIHEGRSIARVGLGPMPQLREDAEHIQKVGRPLGRLHNGKVRIDGRRGDATLAGNLVSLRDLFRRWRGADVRPDRLHPPLDQDVIVGVAARDGWLWRVRVLPRRQQPHVRVVFAHCCPIRYRETRFSSVTGKPRFRRASSICLRAP